MEGEGSAERRDRIRQRMKEFYGDPGTSTRRSAEAPRHKPAVQPEMDLDSEYFNVSKYTTDLLRRESLKGLVESDTALLRSVRRLDGELQELVYRNYAKFISATDTIREMRDNVTEMDTKLLALSTTVDDIDALSRRVDEQLRAHRSRIEETISTNRMLKKVQFLQALPTTMRQLMERREYNACVKYWVAGDGFLARHTTIPAIARIQHDCRTLAEELYQVMERAMCALPLDDPDAMETLRGYVEDLRLLRATSLFANAVHDAEGRDFEQTVLHALMGSVTANFHTGVDAARRGWRAALSVPDTLATLSLTQRQALLSQPTLREALAQLKAACALLAVNSERVHMLLNQLEPGTEAALGLRIGQAIQPVLIDLLTPLPQLLRELIVAVLKSMLQEGRALRRDPDALRAALRASVVGFLQQLKHLSVTLRTLGDNYLDTALHSQSKAYAALVDQALGEVLQGCVTVCAAQLAQRPTSEALTAMEVEATLQERALGFALARCAGAAVADDLARESQLLLGVDEVMSSAVLDPVREHLRDLAHGLTARAVVLLGMNAVDAVWADGFAGVWGTTREVVVPSGVLELLRQWGSVSRVLDVLRADVVTAAANSTSRPAAPARTVERYGGDALRVYNRLQYTNGGTSSVERGAGKASSAGHSSSDRRASTTLTGRHRTRGLIVSYTRPEHATLQRNVHGIFFVEDTVLHTAPTGNGGASEIMRGVVLYVCKALVDRVRREPRYDEVGFQRVQLSCTLLLRALLTPTKGSAARRWVREWGQDTLRTIQRLLDDCCTAAYDRYEEKLPLPDAVLDKMVDDALKERGTEEVERRTEVDKPTSEAVVCAAVATAAQEQTAPRPAVQLVEQRVTAQDEELPL